MLSFPTVIHLAMLPLLPAFPSLPMDVHIRKQVLQFIETYVFADWKFLTFLGILTLVDGLLSMVQCWQIRSFNCKIITFFLQKLTIYACFLVLVHIMAHFTIAGKPNIFFGWLDDLAYAALIVRESVSVLETMGAIRPGLVPEWILKKLKYYDKNGHFETQPDK